MSSSSAVENCGVDRRLVRSAASAEVVPRTDFASRAVPAPGDCADGESNCWVDEDMLANMAEAERGRMSNGLIESYPAGAAAAAEGKVDVDSE